MPALPTPRPSRAVRRGWLWLAGLGLAGLVSLLVGMASARGLGSDPLMRLGYFLPLAGLIAGALHLLFRRKVTRATGWLGFVLVYAILLGGSQLGLRRIKAEAVQAVVAELGAAAR